METIIPEFGIKRENENQDYDHWIYFLEKAVSRLAELGYVKRASAAILEGISANKANQQ